jgi:thiol-disulfide isomerase/thioredoxin
MSGASIIALAITWLVIILGFSLAWQLLRQNGRILLRLEEFEKHLNRLPRLDGHGELALSELRGKHVLLVFSSPHCGPCNALAPELEKFHRRHPEPELLMISKGEPKENRAKVKEHGLTFSIVLQQQWEISRRYAMFATPVACLIDERACSITTWLSAQMRFWISWAAPTAAWLEGQRTPARGRGQRSSIPRTVPTGATPRRFARR